MEQHTLTVIVAMIEACRHMCGGSKTSVFFMLRVEAMIKLLHFADSIASQVLMNSHEVGAGKRLGRKLAWSRGLQSKASRASVVRRRIR